MKKVGKKLLSLLLVVMLLASAIPFAAMAAEAKSVTVHVIKQNGENEATVSDTLELEDEKVDVITLAKLVDLSWEADGFEFVRYDAGSGAVSTIGDITIVDGMTVYIRVAMPQNTTPETPDEGDEGETETETTTTSVRFIVDGVEYATITQTEGATAGLPATPYKTGYNFEGWYSRENGAGHRIYNGVTWYADSYTTTYYAHFVSNKVVDNNTIRIFVQSYVGSTLKATKEIDSVQLETGENAFNWLYYNKDRIDGLVEAAYPGYNWDPQLYYDYSGKEPLTEQNLTANGTKSVCIKVYSEVEANVLLYVHKGSASATPAIYEMPGYVKGDTVSRTAVETLVKKYYSGKNMTLQGLYNDEAWQDLLEDKAPTAANGVKVDSNGTIRIHVILKNATAGGTADPTNPKTGDYILPIAMTAMILSGLAAAAFVCSKKRV